MIDTDVVLIGAGPIGLELAVALKHAGVDYTHLEAGQIGQTITWYPRQVRFFSSPDRIAIAGVPLQTIDQAKATREEYLTYLRGIVEQFDLDISTFERVVGLERDAVGGVFHVRCTRGGRQHQTYQAKHVVLAIGDMHRPRLLHVPGEDLPHVSHYFEEPHKYFRKRLLIVGGKNSAAEAALRCSRAGASVAMSYRRAEFNPSSVKYWLLPELLGQIKVGKIDFYPCTAVKQIQGDAVELVPSEHGDGSAKPVRVPADFVLLLTGYEMDSTLLEMAGAELEGDNRAPRLDPVTMMTTVENLYVAGTAAAGTQLRYRLFIENCHIHVTRIVRAITGSAPPAELVNDAASRYELPES